MDKSGIRVKMKDGSTFENGRAGYADGFLWLYLPNVSIVEAFNTFSDPVKTDVIVFEYGGMSDTYEGFTNFRTISVDNDGLASVCMTKGAGK